MAQTWRGWQMWARTGSRFLPFLRKRRRGLAVALLCGLGYQLLGMVEPWFLKLLLDNVVLGQPLPVMLRTPLAPVSNDRLLLLNALVVGLVLLVLVRGVLYYYQQIASARAGQNTAADIRVAVYQHLNHLCARFHDRRRTGDVLTRLTSDVRQLRDIFIALPLSVAGELAVLVGMTTVMLLMDWSLTLVALTALPAIAILLRMYQAPMKQAMRTQRERESHLASVAHEVLGAIRLVQSHGREDYETDRFRTQNKRTLRTGMRAARLEAKLRWFSEVTVVIVSAAVLSIATRRVLTGALSPGEMLVFVTYLRAFNRPLRRISKMAERAARGAASGERILEILNTEPAVVDVPGAVRARRIRGDIQFENVSFEYRRSEPILDRINLHIARGERVAVVGPTGSGKSTLLSLISRFYEPTEGCVRIDGRDVREYRLASMRGSISHVFQEPLLFATSIAENIAYGRTEATADEVVRAAESAGLHRIIAALPAGYETVVSERGGTLSGGQRQCVAIARAILKDAPIVVLDEPTAGLDNQASAMVMEALRGLMDGRTVVMITHDMGTIRDFDRVVVLDRGRIVDIGTHQALAGREGLYRAYQRLDWKTAS
jgi:ATP-binding cassette, subfamily B, bacterial